MMVSIIAAMAQNRVIGRGDGLPWRIPQDFRWFRTHTEGRSVIMGRKTYESIGRTLPGRRNLILSTRPGFSVPGADNHATLEAALESCAARGEEEVFIIGGETLYRESLPRSDRIYLTVIHRDFEGDVFFPEIPEGEFKTVFQEYHGVNGPGDDPGLTYTFMILERGSHPSRF
jgi:dihydrofolate reductase